MYCGACLHGNTLAVAVRDAGEDVLLVPAYTPVRADEPPPPGGRLAFGGINVYLQQKSAFFRGTPWLLDRLWDWPPLLRWLGKLSAAVRPEKLGPLVVSMLRGEHGHQRKEVEKLVAWLAHEVRPDVVHLSTAMLVGAARHLRQEFGAAVVATLSGEDLFIERLAQPYRDQARRLLAKRAAELDGLIALNRYYAEFMTEYLGLPPGRVRVIPPGLNLVGHRRPDNPAPAAGRPSGRPLTIGYLARIVPEKGLHLLAQALERLGDDPQLPNLRLSVGGYLDPADRPYLGEIEARLAARGLRERFAYAGSLGRQEKIALVQSFDVMSVPTISPESKGIYVLEAWANGVPVVLPDHGAFSELVADTGGGLLFRPGDVASLADGLRQLLLDRRRAADCGAAAQQVMHQRYTAQRMALQTVELYRSLRSGRQGAAGGGQSAVGSGQSAVAGGGGGSQ
jgi:glycosyltransferase involved in cell wall biosynthesis